MSRDHEEVRLAWGGRESVYVYGSGAVVKDVTSTWPEMFAILRRGESTGEWEYVT